MSVTLTSRIPPDLLYSNRLASDEEACHIQRFLIEQESRIAQIDQDIDELRQRYAERLRQLRDERDDIHESLQLHKGLISPTRRTPPEIWSKIFKQCLDSQIGLTPVQANGNAMRISQVCRLWRDVSTSMHALWNHFRVDPRTKSNILIRTWLARSGDLPLTIEVYDDGGIPAVDYVEALIPSSSRWANLCICSSENAVRKLLCDPRVTAPTLSAVHIIFISVSDEITRPLDFIPLPCLTRATLNINPFKSEFLHLPWAQLTDLHSNRTTDDVNDCFDIMRLCPNLERLHLNLEECIGVVLQPVTFPVMTSLSLSSENLQPLLDNIICPDLKYIHLDLDGCGGESQSKTQLLALICNKSMALSTLHIEQRRPRIQLTDHEITTCFECIQTLLELHISDIHTTKVYCRGQVNNAFGQLIYDQALR